MLYQALIPSLALIATALSNPLPNANSTKAVYYKREASLTWENDIHSPAIRLLKRNLDTFVTLDNGNQCEIQASAGSGTSGWSTDDFANMYDQAGRGLTGSISRNNNPNAGLTFSFRDHNGIDHQIDAEATTTGQASVSIQGAFDNVGRALLAAEQLADDNNTGLIGTARNSISIFFGSVIAISVAVNVLN